ncbi:adenine phosphoribosyltransferase-like [Patiria miniata]|uniref:Adenine phosphoribosyltransferase n=1 Tax=Patiria miniata TaxID=46514 RepID=A0A914B1X3_PATMI|nr:adenine phosphoribosyltransferase-like [Patiria miniata]
MGDENTRISRVKGAITAIQDFPKPGVLFRDIFPLFKDPAVLSDAVSLMVEHIKDKIGSVDVIVGLEARGFLFGPMMSVQLGCSFVPIRKKGKLPGKCVQASYLLEYGTDIMEAQAEAIKPGQKVVIVDDLIATGGTMSAAVELISKMEGRVVECLVLIELLDLKGVAKLKHPFFSVLQF